jgi:multidrug efflux pump subunit AcrA (membrane-fusion protein)
MRGLSSAKAAAVLALVLPAAALAQSDLAPASAPAAAPAGAQGQAQVRKGVLSAEVPIEGRAQPYNTWPAFAPFDGQVQSVLVLPGQWVSKNETLVVLIDKELAAMLAAEPTTPPEIVAKRWGVAYRPAEVRCPFDNGYIVNVLVRGRQTVRSGDPLLSAAPSLKITSPATSPAITGLAQGATAVVWTKHDPDTTYKGTLLEVKPEGKDASGKQQPAEVTVLLPPRADGIDSGVEMQGKVLFSRPDVLKIPSSAITHADGKAFATVELKIGADNGEEAELITPLPEGSLVIMPQHPEPKRREPKHVKPIRDKTPQAQIENVR